MTPFSSWTDVNGSKNRYWHGNQNHTNEGCKCSTENSCLTDFSAARNINYKCHCDSYLPNAHDDGLLISTKKLPVMKLHYGGSITPYSSINFKLNPMICSGKKDFYPSESAIKERNQLKQEILSMKNELNQRDSEIDIINNSTLKVSSDFNNSQFTFGIKIKSENALFRQQMESFIEKEISLLNDKLTLLNSTMKDTETTAFRAGGHNTGGGTLCKFIKLLNLFSMII